MCSSLDGGRAGFSGDRLWFVACNQSYSAVGGTLTKTTQWWPQTERGSCRWRDWYKHFASKFQVVQMSFIMIVDGCIFDIALYYMRVMRWSESETQFSHTIENFWSTAGKTIKKGVCRNCHRSKTAQVHLGSSHTSKMKVKENFRTFSHKFFFFYMPNISFCDGRAQLTHTTFCSPPLQPCIWTQIWKLKFCPHFLDMSLNPMTRKDVGQQQIFCLLTSFISTTSLGDVSLMWNFFDPEYDSTDLSDSAECARGDELYERPKGWYRMALKVKDKYPDGDTWLGDNGWRSHS